jgi:cysteine synthase
MAGAQLVEVPPRPAASPNFYVKLGARLADELGAFFTGQFDNAAGNRQAHVESTAPEIYKQLDGAVDGFSCSAGTGGTIAGCADGLRALTNGRVKIALTDPCGAKLYRYFTEGELRAEGDSITEGIGQGRITGNLEGFTPDFAFEIRDEEALRVTMDICKHEGLALGLSSGINVAGAMKFAKELPEGSNVVTILCDDAARYKKKMGVLFLQSKGLPFPDWLPKDENDLALSQEVQDAVKRATVSED